MQNNHYLSPATGQALTRPPQHLSRWLSFLTILLGMIPTLSQAQVGKVAEFSRASNDYITVPNAPYFGSDFTIETWVYPKTYNDDQPIFDFPVNGAKLRLHINYTNGQLSLFNGTTSFLSTTSAVPLQQWSHIAITVAGNNLKFYVNGVQSGSTNTTFSWNPVANTTSTPFTIGKSDPSGTDYADMYMDEFRVWKTARTQTEIQGAMNTALTGNENNLVLYYDMENVTNGNGQAMPNKVVTPPVPNFSSIFVGGSTTFTSQTFTYTGGQQTFTVPVGVYSITADVIGGKGGNSSITTSTGGNGARVQTTLAVTPGQVLYIYAGGAGGNSNNTPGYNGGANNPNTPSFSTSIGGGGGASDIRIGGVALTNRVVVAGGGGGGGFHSGVETGGHGGLVGGNGSIPAGIPAGGGTSTAGGSGGSYSGYNSGAAGTLGNGGSGGVLTGGAGGGGGYYGGGGGSYSGGGGGSSYSSGTATTYTTGYNTTGNGYVVLSSGILISSGKYGDGLDLNSVKIDLGYPHFTDQQLGGNYTVEGWVYPESNANNGILYAATSSTSDSIVVGVSQGTTGKPFFRAKIGGSVIGTIYPTTALPLNQWSHIAVSIYSSLVTLYVNGISVGTATLTQAIPVLGRNAQIGGNADIKVDEFHVWSVSRTQSEIQTAMAAQLTGNEANLYANYDMENAGSTTTKLVKNNSADPISAKRPAQTNGNMRFFDAVNPTSSLPGGVNGLGNALYVATNSAQYSYMVAGESSHFNGSLPLVAAGAFTVEGWIKPKITGSGTIIGFATTSNDYPFHLAYNNGQVTFSRSVGGTTAAYTIPTYINDGKFHHISIVYPASYGPSVVYIYIDGVNVANPTFSLSGAGHAASAMVLGVNMEGSIMDEWRVLQTARTPTSTNMNQSEPDANTYFNMTGDPTTTYILLSPNLSNYVGSYNTDVSRVAKLQGSNTAFYLYDSGGSGGSYGNNENFTYVVYPGVVGNRIGFYMYNWNTENNADYVKIYHGTIPNSNNLIVTFTGSGSNSGYYYADGPMCILWHSDGSVTNSGFFANVQESGASNYLTSAYGSPLANPIVSAWNIPFAPADMQVTATPKTATFAWDRMSGVLSHNWIIVDRGAGSSASPIQSGTLNGNNLTISNLMPGKSYDLYVKGKFADGGLGAWSDAIPFTTQNDWKTALNFDGVNDYVVGANYAAGVGGNAITAECWIKPDAGASGVIISRHNGFGWGLYMNGTGNIYAYSSYIANIVTPLPANQWSHIALVCSGEHMYFYLNGKVVNSYHGTYNANTSSLATPIQIGYNSALNAGYFKGSLDEVRVWQTALTPTQIQTYMHQQPAANASGLMLYYKFDEASGTVATNSCTNITSPNGNGTLTSFALTGTASNRVQHSPLVTTPTFANANVSSATVGASLIANGTSVTTERGSVLAPTDNAIFSTVNAVSSAAAGTTTGVYTSNATSLAAGTTYYTRGYALSDEGIGYSPTVTGTTVCPAPNNAVVSNITASSATISWSNSPGYAAYSWRMVASGAGVNGTAIGSGTGTAASPSVNVTSGLTQLSSYDVYLRGTCTGTNVSAWEGPVTFFVPCNNTTLPFAEAFTTTATGTLPSCWRQLDLNTDNVTWSVNATKQANLVGGGVAMNDWLISSQGLPLTGGSSYKVTFKYNAIGSTAEKLMLAWGTTPTEAGLTNVIFDEANIVNTTATTITVLMTPTTTGTYYVGWKGYSDANSAGIMIDDINIDYNPCTTPVASSSIGITNIGGTTATASWNTIAGVTAYEWKVILAGGGNTAAAIFSGTSATGTTSLSGLTPAIEYDFYVRANCGTPIVSDWAGPKTFITLPIPLITATTADNDAYIDLAWSIPVSPCLLNGSGNPYPLGVHVQMKDVGTGAILKQESFPNLATFLGPQQPSFTYTAIGDANGYTVTNTTGSAWQSTLYNWTIESWVKTASTVANASIFHATSNTGVNKLNLTLDGSNIKLSGTNLAGAAVNTTFTNTIPQNRWMHLAVAYNAATKKAVLYINGVEKESKTIENIIPAGNYKSMETFTDANMAELRFWNRTRTSAEIATSYLQTSFAGQAQTNLLLHWRWNTGSGQPTDLATNYDTQTNSATGGLTTVTYTATPQYIPITGDFRHWVGPSQTKNYQLNVIEMGSGATVAVCSNLSATGTTKAYQPVQLVNATDNLLEKVTLTWKNKSKMSEGFRILRAGKVIKVMSGTTQIDSIFNFTDTYVDGDTNSIVNGTVYNYCVEAYNATFNATYPQLCNTGTTFNLNFAATDNAFTNKVNLSWANVSTYGYALNVLRDGVIIKTLDKNAISYTDNSPYYGKKHLYGIALVNASNSIVVADYDNGGVTARGSIAGRVEALEGKYGMPNIKVKLNSLVDTTFSDSVYTNYKGEFAFNNLYYGLSGEFTLTASKAGHTFTENPKNVTLSNVNYVVSNVVFVDSFALTPDANTLAITNFQATAVNTADKVDLTWTYPYTAADTTVFNVYRENTLLATLTDLGGVVTTFTDFTGFPNQYYLYKIVGYRLTGNTVLAGMDTTTRQFPAVTKPTTFVVTPNTTIGNVALSWANTSTNFDGFNLYRNGAKIADLDKYAVAYTDVDGQPSTAIVYSIKAKRKFTDLTEESAATTAASINFPTLSAPTTFTASATTATNLLRNSVALSWTIPTVLQNLNYNYDGYRIYRKDNTTNTTVLIGQIAKSFPLAHEDKEGIPSRSYTYTIKTYVKLGNNLFESAATTANPATVSFPAVRALTGTLTASTNTLEGEVSLAWTSSSYALGGRNLDGQIVMKGNDTLAFVPLTANTYRVFTNNTAATTYSVRTYRKLNGVTYISAPLSNTANTGKPAMGTTSPEFVSNFKASQDLPNHVRLNWVYPPYIYSTFKVYRDNVLIATLSTDYRTYYDDNATQGATHLYQVEAINGASVAQKVGSWGKLKSICVIQGIAEAQAAGYGMPNVEVVASATNFYARTFTDSAGYYKFDNVPQDQGLVVNVKAEGPNCTFSLASQNVTIGTAKTYNVNFLNTYTPNPTDTLTPAKPAFVRAISDYAQRQVTVTWNPANTQYDGFEVYRANTLLGSVTKGSDMVMHDGDGYAGVLYNYSVRGYVEGEGERIYSDAKALTIVFPVIDTVVYLTADLFSHANSVNLTWSHRWDNHTYYLVERNGEPVDTIMTGESLNFTDNKGAPGQLYTYTVTAVMNESGKNYTSIPVSVQVTYPGISEITNLTATIPFDLTTPNTTPCNLTAARNQNAVTLTWNYEGLNNGFKVYRNNEYLGRVAKDTLNYTDIAGIPGLDAQYTVRAVVNRDGIDFVSPGNTITANFPNISAPYNVTALDSAGLTYLRWEYPEDAASGFYIFRGLSAATPSAFDTVVVDSFTKGIYYYADKNGGADLSYTYYLQTYSTRNNVTYYSDKFQCLAPHIYPKPAAPTMCAASDGTYTSYIKVSWVYAVENNLSGFEIYRDGASVGSVTAGMRTFFDKNAPSFASYTVKAFRKIGVNKYYSNASNADNGTTSAPANFLTLGTQTNKRFGRAVSAEQDVMVAGAPGFGLADSGYVKVFKFDFTTRNWSAVSTIAKYEEEFGRSVSISTNGNTTNAIYQPLVGAPAGNKGYIYTFSAANSLIATTPIPVVTSPASAFSGSSITGRYGQYIYVGSPKYNNNTGIVYIQSGSPISTPQSISGLTSGSEFGYAMDWGASNFIAIGAPGANKVYTTSSVITSNTTANSMGNWFQNLAGGNDRLGHAVGVGSNNYVIAGAPNHSGTGKAFITWSGASPADVTLLCPDCNTGDQFGWSVDVEGNWAIVGAPAHNGGRGAAYLYRKTGAGNVNTWAFTKKFSYASANDSVGVSVDITDKLVTIGSPNADNGNGRVYWELLDGIIANFAASDGTFADKTKLTWEYYGTTANISGFNLYRDGTWIAAAANTATSYEDGDGVGGKTYVYEIAPVATGTNGTPIRYTSDEGFRKPDGSITGDVVTIEGGGVAGVAIKAVANIDGNFYTYNTTSDINGHYAMSNVYYTDSTTFYALTADYKNHIFMVNPIGTYITAPLNFTYTKFYDKTAFVIGGKVQREGSLTGLDSIKVTPIYLFADNTTSQGTSVWSDKKGKYAVTVDPYKVGLSKIIVQIDGSRSYNNGKTIYYKFNPAGIDTIADVANLPSYTKLDFMDTTRYPVMLSVITACSTTVTGGKFQIHAVADDGSFEQTYTTNLNGTITAYLPPYNYTLSVEGVENLNIPNELVVNYLRYRPEELKLADLDRDTARDINETTMTLLTARKFLYHKPPAISLLDIGTAKYLCNNSNKAIIVKKGSSYKFGFSVLENHTTLCNVQTGYLMVENAGAKVSSLKVNRNGNKFEYTFEAGDPNLVYPYTRTINVKYYSDKNELLGNKTFALLIEGSAALPGNDIIVDPSKGNSIPIPLFVLRDPPGDGSSSTLEAGSTTTSHFASNYEHTFNGGVQGDFHFAALGFGIHLTTALTAGGVWGHGYEWELSTTTNKAISTSDSPDMVGPEADVIVGAGLAMQYGIIQNISVADGCNPSITTQLGISQDRFNTDWVYTVKDIKALISQYEQQLVDIEGGKLVISDTIQKTTTVNGVKQTTFESRALTKTEAKVRVETRRKNWKSVLTYHTSTTVPHVQLCKITSSQFDDFLMSATFWENVGTFFGFSDRKARVIKLQSDFCKEIGTGVGDNFMLKDSAMIWNVSKINLYNNTTSAIRQILNEFETDDWVKSASATQMSVEDYTVSSVHTLLHGQQAKNITFGGGTNYSETFESANATSTAYSTSVTFNASLGIGPFFKKNFAFEAAPFGIGLSDGALELENELGFTFEYGLTETNDRDVAKESTNLISYTLTDDDPGDQFSVTVIQGVNTNHTPYFALVGGRSSCPQEAGTIYRDRPNIALIDTLTKSTSQAQIQEHLAPEETAVFQAQLANLSVFYEERNVLVGLDPSSNPDGAVVTMGGVQLGVDLVPFTLKANKPVEFPILVSRGPIEYEYDSLTIQIFPDCDESDLLDTTTIKTAIYLSAHFESPCSEINILEPDDHWTINRRDVFDNNSRELLPIKLVDYDPTNDKLAGVRVEYRRKGNTQWTIMDGAEFDTDSLARHNSKYFLPGQVPYYLHIWDITDDYTNFPDGEYEIRAVADCEASGHLYSKTLSGVIDRKSQLLTNPEPADHIWTNGDEISVNFNKNLDCAVIADSNFIVRSLTQANTFLPGLVGCYEHKLIFTPAMPVRYFDGNTLQIVVAGVKSYNGNLLDTVRWDFVVQGKDLYVKNNRFEISVNQGDSATVPPVLVNNRESNTTINYAIDLSGNTAWLSSENATGKVLANYPETVNLNIASANLPLGDKVVALAVKGDGFPASDSIYLTVHVLPVAPHWEVNPANYSQSMTVLSNYLLNNNAATKSTDSMDMISVWIDNTIRGVAKLSKVNATEYTAIIQTYGDAADAGKTLSFRVWDSSTATEYDAKPVGTNVVVNFANNAMVGGILSPMMLNVNTASDKARYIPLNAGWTMFSVNTNNWNTSINKALASLKHPHTGDLIKTATKTASYTGTTWLGAGGTNLDSTNVHRGYQIYLQEADTIRISGANATIKPITLQQGWNLVGMPLQAETPLATALNFFNQPDTIRVKTVAQNPSYSKNMVAFYEGSTWFAPNGSDMDKVRPYFAYLMKVNTANSELLYPGYVGNATPVVLRTAVTPFDNYDHESWKVFAPDYAQNMLITATVDYNKTEIADENSLVAAYVGAECRGVGKVTYVPELKKNIVSMFVYTNNADEIVDFRIYDAKNDKYFDNHEPMTFRNDSIVGRYDSPYHFSNVAPDNSFNGSVYPNPFSHKFTVNLKSDKAQTYQVQLLDVAGHVIEKVKLDTESTDISHTIRTDALDLPSGVYILQVKGSLGETRSFKLVHNEE